MQEGTPAAKMEVKTSLLDNMIGVGDMVLLEPLSEDSFIENLRNRFDHNEIYVSRPRSSPATVPYSTARPRFQRPASASLNAQLLLTPPLFARSLAHTATEPINEAIHQGM